MVQQGSTEAMTMVKVIETIFLGPGDICCNALGVGHENNRELVRMLLNSFILDGGRQHLHGDCRLAEGKEFDPT
jgi:hypothetical protein